MIDNLADAVEDAIDEGCTPREFIIKAAQLWDEKMDEKAKYARREFNKILESLS